ncbi:hypothetical protein IFM89_000030 [Coptis chinensis]|uniref:Uncharacterized protein n=1 Tax=Coptis chinensis TaxID=261450 RepID=A0A835IJ69_9MAGN|nr:hypothetical protein IFM89_000030 [Coptis chinensis]
MNDVKNPIIIDQNYCDQDNPCKEQVPIMTEAKKLHAIIQPYFAELFKSELADYGSCTDTTYEDRRPNMMA